MNIGVLQKSITSSVSAESGISRVGAQSSSGDASRATCLSSNNQGLSLDGHKMAVVNLEAALASWKSFDNQKVSCLSNQYRQSVSSNLRISPNRVGTVPGNLMEYMLSSDRVL